MALRDQPYIPLYVQDFLTDEKLAECSAEANGVYIRLLCLMHKSEEYGTILLKQKYKQNTKQIINFALQVAKHLPYPQEVTIAAMDELLIEGVINIAGEKLFQKRMVNDNRVSEARKLAGEKGGKKTQSKNKDFALAKSEANTEYEYETENEVKVVINNKGANEKFASMLLESENVFTTIQFQTKLNKNDTKDLVNMFVAQINSTNELHNNYSDYASHCINWCKHNVKLVKDRASKPGKLESIYNNTQLAKLKAAQRNGE